MTPAKPNRDRDRYRALWTAATIHVWTRPLVMRGHRGKLEPVGVKRPKLVLARIWEG